MRAWSLGVLVAALCAAGTAGAESRAGAGFLSVPLSVRQMGMGEVSMGGTDVLRAWSNPALLVEQETSGEIAIHGASRFSGENTLGGFGGGWRLGPDLVVGGLASYFDAGAPEIDELGNATGRRVGQSGMSVGATGAYRIRWVTVGATVKGVSEDLLGKSATGVAADLGAVAAWRTLYGGIAARNLGPNLREAQAGWFAESLPLELRGGLAYFHEPWGVTAGAEYSWVSGAGGSAGAGADWWPVPFVGLRAGVLGLGEADTARFSVGISGVYNRMGVDYALVTHPLGAQHNVSLSCAFGPMAFATKLVRAPTARHLFAGRLQEGRLNIAVGELEAQNVPKGDAAVIADLLRRELVEAGSFNVVEKAQMDRIMTEQMFQQYGCTSEECVVKMGQLLNVQAMIAGSFGRLAGRYFVNIRVVDIETAKAVYADSAAGRNIDKVREGLKELAGRLAAALL